MTTKATAVKAGARSLDRAPPQGGAGESGAFLSPPDYGIDFIRAGAIPAAPIQRQAEAGAASGRTGLPGGLKAGIEALSGFDMSDVRVSFNSDKPARYRALAYAQGSDIHLGPGQERHLAHEAWHVVQQRQGRVKPTMQMAGAGVNDDAALEAEADAMGREAMQRQSAPAARPARRAAGSGAIQRRVGLEIEIAVPSDDLTALQITGLQNYVTGIHPAAPTALQIAHAQGLADAGRVGTYQGVIPPGMANAGFHVDTDHDDRVRSPQGTWPPKEAADGILEIVMDPPVATTAELDTTMNNIQTFLNTINANTNNLRTHWVNAGGGVNVGPLYFPGYVGAGIPRRKQRNHNFMGSLQANVGVDLREYHSMLKWYANKSGYAPRAPRGAAPVIANQKADMVAAVNIGRTAIAHIRTVGFAPLVLPLTNLQFAQMGNLRGLRGWLTHCALALLRGAYVWGLGNSFKNIVPVLLKSPNDLVMQHGMTAQEMAYYTANKAHIITYMLNATNRLAVDGTFGNRAFKIGGAGVGAARPQWTIPQLFDENLNNAGLIAAANIKNPSDVGAARTGNAQVTAIPDAPIIAGLGGGPGRRAGMVLEFRTIRGLYDGMSAWKNVAKTFLKAANARNRRSGIAP